MYYGFIYKGKNRTYDIKKAVPFDDPYSALKKANDLWNSEPNHQIARLLVVFNFDQNDNFSSYKYSYFQFTDPESCIKFIEDRSEILWSIDNKQIWNGNAKLME